MEVNVEPVGGTGGGNSSVISLSDASPRSTPKEIVVNGVSLRYPRNAQSSGFLGDLNEKQEKALSKMRQLTNEAGVDMTVLAKFSLHDDLTLLRFWRANKFDCAATMAAINVAMDWRKNKVDIVACRENCPDVVMNCHIKVIHKLYPHWHCNFDKVGRPVMYKQYVYDSP
jgi:hypothetical protein